MSLLKRIRGRINQVRFRPNVRTQRVANLCTLGTTYGGWTFVDLPSLRGATIISGGLGEDASFDVAFAQKYAGRVVIVDPTPRAVTHYNAILARLGAPAERGFVRGGEQPVEAYDLRGLTEANFKMAPKALWTSNDPVRFYAPKDPRHVSHSITNFQNAYKDDTPYIEVPATTCVQLLAEEGVTAPELIKLDIEGAERQVIEHLLQAGVRPRQILVEFDELGVPSAESLEMWRAIHAKILAAGYQCVHWNGQADFTYLRSD